MEIFHEGSASYLYVGNVANGVSDGDPIDDIAAGSVAFCTEENKAELVANTTDVLRLAQKLADGTIIYSPYFDMSKIKNKIGTSWADGTDQTTFVGYNGSSGALDATADKYFSIDTEWLNTQPDWNNTPFRFEADHHTVAASQSELAFGLVKSGNALMSRQPFRFIKYEAVGDGTVAAITGTSTITKVTNDSVSVGSYIKTADATATFDASTSTVTDATILNIPSGNGRSFSYTQTLLGSSAGSAATYIGETAYLIADQGTAAQNATAMAAAINAGTQATASVATATITITYNDGHYYLPPLAMETADDSTWTNVAVTILTGDDEETKHKISGTTAAAATFTLDQAYLGPTGYIFDGTTAATQSGIATVTNYGVKMTGQDNSSFDPVNDNYSKTRFKIFIADTFVTATETTTEAIDDTNETKSIAQQEVYSQFLDKDPVISDYPRTKYRSEVDLTGIYDICSFNVEEVNNVGAATGIGINKSFAIKVATKVALTGDDIDTVLGVTV